MEIMTRKRGDRVSFYFPHDIRERLQKLVEQGASASAVVTTCMRSGLPTVEREMKRQKAEKKKTR